MTNNAIFYEFRFEPKKELLRPIDNFYHQMDKEWEESTGKLLYQKSKMEHNLVLEKQTHPNMDHTT